MHLLSLLLLLYYLLYHYYYYYYYSKQPFRAGSFPVEVWLIP